MKRRLLFILAFLSFLLPCLHATQTMAPNIFAFAGFRMASGQGMAGSFVTGLGMSIPLARKTRLGIGVAFIRSSEPNGAGPSTLPSQAASSPFFVYLRQELFKGKLLSTYASLSAGIQFPGARALGAAAVPENVAARPAGPSVVLRAAGGLSLAVMSHLRLFAEGAYLSGKKTAASQSYFLGRILQNSFRFDIKAVQLCLGAQFYF